MKRLFIAIRLDPDQDFLRQFRQLKQDLSHERIKWVGEHNIHVTLKFLGDTEEKKIPEIASVLKGIAAGSELFTIRLRSTGIFGSRYAPRVVWAGIDPYDSLLELMKKVHEGLRITGFEPDGQNLVPHLTLGRIREIRNNRLFQQIIDRFRELLSKDILVKEFTLYESILKKEGPLYIALGTYPFGN